MTTTAVIYELIGRDNASPAFRSAGRSAEDTDSRFAKLGRTATVVGGAIAAGAAVVAVESVKMASTFQSQMEKIHTQAGATQGSVKSLTAEVLKMAPAAQQGPQELAAALYHLKSLGMDNASAMKALAQSSNLAAVGGANLEETATAIGAAWRSGIKGGQSFAQVAGTVNAIIGAGNMTMEDFVQSLSSGVLPAARTFGVSLKSVGAAMALMTDEGIPAQLAATRLRMSLSLLGAPSQQASKWLAQIGLTGTMLADAMRSPGGIVAAIQLLKQHLDASGLSASKQAMILSRAFGGGQSSSAIMTMVNNLGVLEKKQVQINDSTGRYGSAVAAQRKTAQAQFALLRSTLDTLGIRIGLALLPPVTKFAQFLTTTVVPGAEKAAGKIGKVFNAVIPVKSIEKDWTDVLAFFGVKKPKPVTLPPPKIAPGPKPNLDTFYGGLAPPPLDTFYGGLTKQQFKPLSLKASDLYNVQPGASSLAGFQGPTPAFNYGGALKVDPTKLASGLTSSLSKINWGAIIAKAITAGEKSANMIGNALIMLISKINWTAMGKAFVFALVPFAVGLVNNLIDALLSEAIHHPLDLLSFLLTLIPIGKGAGILIDIFDKVPILGTLTKWLLSPIEKLGGLAETALGKVLKKVFGPVSDLIGRYFAKASTWLLSAGDDVVLGLLSGVEERWPKLASWIAGIRGRVLRFFVSAAAWLLKSGVDVISGLWDGLEERFPAVTRWLGGIGGRVKAIFGGAARWLLNAGGNLISGFLGGIRAKMAGIASWVRGNIVDPVVNWVKHFFGIHSPSTVFHGIGLNLVGGLLRGLATTDGEAIARTIFGSLPKALGSIVEKGLVSVAALPGKALKALGGLGGDVLSFLGIGGGAGPGGGAPAANAALARRLFPQWGSGAEWGAWNYLAMRESGWNQYARNPSSGAYGIAQALPPTKMPFAAQAAGGSNPAAQIRWMAGYIAQRYGDPIAAAQHEAAFSWYGHGGTFRAGQLIGVGDRGPELLQFGQPGTVYSPEQSAAINAPPSFDVRVFIGDTELTGMIRTEISEHDRQVTRAARAGTGRAG